MQSGNAIAPHVLHYVLKPLPSSFWFAAITAN
jgi:hypothetical protein